MRDVTEIKLQVIAESGNKCWLNGVVSRNNPLTGHHIIAVRNGGQTIKENIAPVSKEKHEAFNQLERGYPDLAREITYYLITFRGNYDEKITERIDKLLLLVEKKSQREHKNRYFFEKSKVKKHR